MCGFSLLSIQNYHLSVLSVAVCYFSQFLCIFMHFLQRKKVIIATSNLCLLGGCVGVHASNAFDTSVLKV